jgi:hypothetical protein
VNEKVIDLYYLLQSHIITDEVLSALGADEQTITSLRKTPSNIRMKGTLLKNLTASFNKLSGQIEENAQRWRKFMTIAELCDKDNNVTGLNLIYSNQRPRSLVVYGVKFKAPPGLSILSDGVWRAE